MTEQSPEQAAAVAAQQRQVSGTVSAGTAPQAPAQDAAAAAAVAQQASQPVTPPTPAPAFSAQPTGPENPNAVAAAVSPWAEVDPAVMDALRAQIVADVREQFAAEARQREIDSTQQSGWYPAPDGWVAPENRTDVRTTLPGEHKYATAKLVRDVFLPGGGTQPVESVLMVSPQGDLVASV